MLRITKGVFRDGHNHDLAWAEPEWPLAGEVFSEDGNHTLHATHDSAVDDHRTLSACLCGVIEVEADWQLEVELHSSTLEFAAEGVKDRDVNLGTIEGAISWVELPLLAGLVEGILQGSLSLIPDLQLSQVPLRSRGEGHLVLQSKYSVDLIHKLQEPQHLTLYLLCTAEDVSVVLLEAANTSEAVEGPTSLISVKDSKVREPHGQLSEGTGAHTKQNAVTGTVHGLETKLRVIDLEAEHVLLVVGRVPGGMPEVKVVNIGSDHLSVLILPVLLSDESKKVVVEACSVGEEEAATRGQVVEEEEFVVQAHNAMVSLLCLLNTLLILSHQLLIREGDTVHALKRFLLYISTPVSSGARVDCHSRDVARGRDVRSTAEINQGSVTVQGQDGLGWELVDKLDLELVFQEALESLISADDHAFELLLFLAGRFHTLLQLWLVFIRKASITHVAIIVETFFDRRANCKIHSILKLKRLSKDVRGRVPVSLLAFWIIEGFDRKSCISLKRAAHVPAGAIDVGHKCLLHQTLTDTERNICWCSYSFDTFFDSAVRHSNLDRHVGFLCTCRLSILTCFVLLEERDSLVVIRLLFSDRVGGGFSHSCLVLYDSSTAICYDRSNEHTRKSWVTLFAVKCQHDVCLEYP
mmetsp:Transcript_3792/g.4275  ORF Transcript_3792/g.4275 Transcript_3792/m.4275 type:complete len:638 (+) Transcript_3792:646-2559(+)